MSHLTTYKVCGQRSSLCLGVKRPPAPVEVTYETPIIDSSSSKKLTWFSANKVWNRDNILPDLYIGSLNDAHCVHELKDRGIYRCVNVGGPECYYETQRGTELGIKYLNCPIPDSDSYQLSFELFMPILDFINEDHGSNVLVHCYKGISRSPTIVIGILMHLYDLSFGDAFGKIKECRSIIDPNIGFIIGLDALFVNKTRGRFCHQSDQMVCSYHKDNPKEYRPKLVTFDNDVFILGNSQLLSEFTATKNVQETQLD